MKINLSIILPCYNEAASLRKLIAQYQSVLDEYTNCELILVDNGSTDESWSIMQASIATSKNLQICPIQVPENRGYGHGILAGLSAASGKFCAWSHADLQCPPMDVVRLYEKVKKSRDPMHCFGKGHRISDRGSAKILTRIQSLLARIFVRYPMIEINAQPKLFHRSFYKTWKKPPNGYELDIYAYFMALRYKMDIVSVEVEFLDRAHGQSKWSYSGFSRLRFMVRSFFYLMRLSSAS